MTYRVRRRVVRVVEDEQDNLQQLADLVLVLEDGKECSTEEESSYLLVLWLDTSVGRSLSTTMRVAPTQALVRVQKVLFDFMMKLYYWCTTRYFTPKQCTKHGNGLVAWARGEILASALVEDAAGWSLGQLCTSYRTACRPSGPQQSVSSAGKWDDTTLTAAVTAAFEIRHHLGIAVAAQWSRRVRAGLEDGTRPPVRPPVVPQAAWGPRPLTVRPKDAVNLAHLADAHRYAAVVGSAGSL